MQEVRKDHESTAFGEVVSGGRLCASFVDVTSASETAPPGLPVFVNLLTLAVQRDLQRSPGPLVTWFVRNFLCSLHVIKQSFCSWSWILAQKCVWCVLLTNMS